MRRKANANTWLLLSLGLLVVLTCFDIGRRTLARAQEQAQMSAAARRYEPAFRPGDLAPDFTLPDRNGKLQSLYGLVKRDTLLSFICGCAECRDMQTYLGTLCKALGPKSPDLVAVTSQPAEMEERYRKETGLQRQVLLYEGEGGPVASEWKAHPAPRMFRLSPDRTVKWSGHSPGEAPRLGMLADELASQLGFRSMMSPNDAFPKPPPPPPSLRAR